MSLPWVRLDTQFATNPKVLHLIEDKNHAAVVAYICGLGYSGTHGTDGYIPSGALPFIHANKRMATQLVSVGLWHETPGGYEVNDWAEYQQSGMETAERRKKAQTAALARWHPDDAKPTKPMR